MQLDGKLSWKLDINSQELALTIKALLGKLKPEDFVAAESLAIYLSSRRAEVSKDGHTNAVKHLQSSDDVHWEHRLTKPEWAKSEQIVDQITLNRQTLDQYMLYFYYELVPNNPDVARYHAVKSRNGRLAYSSCHFSSINEAYTRCGVPHEVRLIK